MTNTQWTQSQAANDNRWTHAEYGRLDYCPEILTAYDPPPIPIRRFDWAAWDDNRGEDYATGYGATEAQAIDELIQIIWEREDADASANANG